MFKMRIIVPAVVLAVMLVLTVRFVTARTASVSNPSNVPASMPANKEGFSKQNKDAVSTYRSRLDECFDVPLSELASCQNAGKTPARLDLPPVERCANLPPNASLSCTNASQAPTFALANTGSSQPVDRCANLPPNGPVSCTNASQAPTFALANTGSSQREARPATTLIEAVRQATEPFKNVDKAEAAGYALFHGCVSGPQEGAMGVHLVNGDLVGDGALDSMRPEALLYKIVNGKPQLTGVEYVVIAEAWHAANDAPPVLMGQLFNYVGSPNRYGIPAFYELHVWAWDQNPSGTFADWNPNVSCDNYTSDTLPNSSSH